MHGVAPVPVSRHMSQPPAEVAQPFHSVRGAPSGVWVMITLAWGNVLSILLPGIVAVLALRHLDPTIGALLAHPDKLGAGAGASILFLAALCGGVLEAVSRVVFDTWVPALWQRTPAPSDGSPGPRSVYEYVTPENQAVFQAAVENSYKYANFYGNLSMAMGFLMATRLMAHGGCLGRLDGLLGPSAVMLGIAAYIQRGMFNRRIGAFMTQERHRREEDGKRRTSKTTTRRRSKKEDPQDAGQ
jgi:hypothetical protein